MIEPKEVVIGVLAGFSLIVFGLVPGLLQALVEGVWNFRDSLFSPPSTPPHRSDKIEQPVWLAGLGAALIAATVLAYLSN